YITKYTRTTTTDNFIFSLHDALPILELVNHLGIHLGHSPEEILKNLEQKQYNEQDIQQQEHRCASDHRYSQDVRQVNADTPARRSEEHTFELQSRENLVCRLLLEKKK